MESISALKVSHLFDVFSKIPSKICGIVHKLCLIRIYNVLYAFSLAGESYKKSGLRVFFQVMPQKVCVKFHVKFLRSIGSLSRH